MPDQVNSSGADIPQQFRFPPFVRILMILFGGITGVYSLYFLVHHVSAETPIFFKLLPTMILFICLDTIFRHLTALNKVLFTEENLVLKSIIKKPLIIPYAKIENLILKKKITVYLQIYYYDESGANKMYQTNASFPKMISILLKIYDLAPNLKLDDKFKDALEYIRIKEQMKSETSKDGN